MTKTKTLKQTQDIPQNVFEKWIEVLIMYKKNNLDKEVTLSEKSLKEAIEWFNKMKDNMLKGISKEDIQMATDKLVETGIEQNQIDKALNVIKDT